MHTSPATILQGEPLSRMQRSWRIRSRGQSVNTRALHPDSQWDLLIILPISIHASLATMRHSFSALQTPTTISISPYHGSQEKRRRSRASRTTRHLHQAIPLQSSLLPTYYKPTSLQPTNPNSNGNLLLVSENVIMLTSSSA